MMDTDIQLSKDALVQHLTIYVVFSIYLCLKYHEHFSRGLFMTNISGALLLVGFICQYLFISSAPCLQAFSNSFLWIIRCTILVFGCYYGFYLRWTNLLLWRPHGCFSCILEIFLCSAHIFNMVLVPPATHACFQL